jgi:septal ring factor EnvC (AmiA/AmiB activator)
MPGGESTSARRLRHVEQELADTKAAFAASQADLTKAIEEARALKVALIATRAERDELTRQLQTEAERHRVLWCLERDACVQLRQRLIAMTEQGDLDRAELVTARAELDRLRKTTTDTEGAP